MRRLARTRDKPEKDHPDLKRAVEQTADPAPRSAPPTKVPTAVEGKFPVYVDDNYNFMKTEDRYLQGVCDNLEAAIDLQAHRGRAPRGRVTHGG